MGKCIGNCIKCDLVPDEDKVVCCSFQTLRQTVELRKALKAVQAKLDEMPDALALPIEMEPYDAESPAAGSQESTVISE